MALLRSSLAVLLLCVASLVAGSAPASAASARSWQWPLPGTARVVSGFMPPAHPYGPGHRGVDLTAPPGTPVRAVAAGFVSHVGVIDGVPTITVAHGSERSTYQPVAAEVTRGTRVAAGEVVGTLARTGSHCRPAVCLHLGRLAGETYLDPLAVLGAVGRARLVDPSGPLPVSLTSTAGFLLRPTNGVVSSRFGMRRHPITGVVKLHDGLDLAAPCGTAVVSPAAGRVTATVVDDDYGLRVVIDHGTWHGRRLVTIANHLERDDVSVGQRVHPGQLVGRVGTSGLSTGCHLHFMVERGGIVTDPWPLLR